MKHIKLTLLILVLSLSCITNYSYSNSVITSTAVIPLATALDYSGAWLTGGSANWFGQDNYSNDYIDAAQSGNVADYQNTYIQTSIAGPCMLTFYWKVSSESSYDKLKFYINGVEQDNISGEIGWAYKSYELPAGTNTVKWVYEKDSVISRGLDCGWVDSVAVSAIQVNRSLANAHAYPVPFIPGWSSLKFKNLTPNCTIEIFTVNGVRVIKFEADSNADAAWNGKDDNGDIMGTGTYMISVRDGNSKKMFPIIIMK